MIRVVEMPSRGSPVATRLFALNEVEVGLHTIHKVMLDGGFQSG